MYSACLVYVIYTIYILHILTSPVNTFDSYWYDFIRVYAMTRLLYYS